MNVWALQKHLNIKHFLLELVRRFGENTFNLDESEQHPQAVMIFMPSQPDLKAYVFSFSQAAERFGIDLYFPLIQHEIVGENEELTIDEVLSIIHANGPTSSLGTSLT